MPASDLSQALDTSDSATSVDLTDSSLRYDHKLDSMDETTHYGRLLNRVGKNKKVLELGSSTGFLTDAMIQGFACQVTGVEIDQDAASVARQKGHQVHVLDLDRTVLDEYFKGQTFDVVLLADVLEHLRDPAATLRQVKSLLAPDGKIVSSIPHIAHGDIRLSLLAGRLPYRPMGLLDHTHMRFFTRALLEDLFVDSGYDLVSVERNRWSLNKTEIKFDYVPLLKPVQDLLASDPESDTYQFIVQAMPAQKESEKIANLPEIEICVFATHIQKSDELYNRTLVQQDYPSDKLRYWFCQGAKNQDNIALCDKPETKSLPYGEHDFRTWRFIGSGHKDSGVTAEEPPFAPQGLTIANIGQTLSRVAKGSSARYIFILTAAALPTVHCLHRLVARAESMRAQGKSAIVCATAEVKGAEAATVGADDTIDWHEFSGMLIPMEFLKDKESIDSSFVSATAQAQDFCFRAWASDLAVVEEASARYFSNGPQLEAASLDARIFDGLRLRRRWGTVRNLVAYARYNLKGSALKAQPLAVDPVPAPLKVLNHAIAACLLESPIGQSKAVQAKEHIGFCGPGATTVGRHPI